MTRIALLTDSHAAFGMLELAARHIEAGAYHRIFHLGDVRGDALWLAARLNRAVEGVAGNCDFLSREAREMELEIEGVRALLTHGDRYGVKSGLIRLSCRAEERKCALALFGHTHIPFAGHVGGALLVNPGALRDGRLAEITIEGGNVVPRLLRLPAPGLGGN